MKSDNRTASRRSDGLEVRPAGDHAEAEEIGNLLLEEITHPGFVPGPEFVWQGQGFLRPTLIGAWSEDRLVGAASLSPYMEHAKAFCGIGRADAAQAVARLVAETDGIAVRPDHRREGIGRKIKLFCDSFAAQHHAAIMVSSSPTRRRQVSTMKRDTSSLNGATASSSSTWTRSASHSYGFTTWTGRSPKRHGPSPYSAKRMGRPWSSASNGPYGVATPQTTFSGSSPLTHRDAPSHDASDTGSKDLPAPDPADKAAPSSAVMFIRSSFHGRRPVHGHLPSIDGCAIIVAGHHPRRRYRMALPSWRATSAIKSSQLFPRVQTRA